MSKITYLYIRYLAWPFTLSGVGGILLALAIARFQITSLEPVYPILPWLGSAGIIGALSCMILAPLVKCAHCGKKALVIPCTFEAGNNHAIYHAKKCHHCGAKL